MKSIYETLEFNKVIEQISSYSRTELAKELLNEAMLFKNEDHLKEELVKLNEMISLILRFQELPIDNSSKILNIISQGVKTGFISIIDFEKIAYDAQISEKVINKFKKIEEFFPSLKDKVNDLVSLKDVEEEIHKIISPNLTIYDHASNELKTIRKKILSHETEVSRIIKSLARDYSEYLTSDNVTLRNGHYVIPVKASYKFKVNGIIHDTSDSGNTYFIEPSQIVELNNKIASLKNDEHDEIMRILRKLTSFVLTKKDGIISNNEILGYLDFLASKAKYAIAENGVVGNISLTRTLKLKEARHPLIDKNLIVPNDFYLDNQKHIIIISGPNAGGKSVALKTIGLLTLLHQCGFPILAQDGAELPFFKRIKIDIGDQQSLNDSLSTFSAHISNIVDFTNKMGSKDLIIIDELGTGTDPQEGEALAKSLIDFIHFKKAYGVISSHFNGVKTYGLDKDYINNASMIFNEENFTPTYKLRLGIPGKSYGMEVALRLGLDKAIIDKARKYLKEDNQHLFSNSLTHLDKLVNEYEKSNKELNERKIKLQKQEENLSREYTKLSVRKEHLLSDVKKEKEEIIENALQQIDEILGSLDKPTIKMHEAINAKSKVEKILNDDEKVLINKNQVINVNDYVIIDEMSLEGIVTRLVNDKIVVQTSLGNIEVHKDEVTRISKPKKPIPKQNNYLTSIDRGIISRSVPLELNIIGKRVEEGLNELEKYLDDVIIKGYESVRIIHGSGTGALRKAVHDYLKTLKEVKSFRLGGMGEGGVGATVVYFK